MINDFLIWWVARLAELVPGRARAAQAASHHGLIVRLLSAADAGPPEVAVMLARRRDIDLGRFVLDAPGLARLHATILARPRAAEVTLVLPAGLLLEREVVLPILAERDPERVLSYEMDRLTPFASSAVFWSWSAVQRDRARGRLHLRLCLIPRAPLQPVIDAFETIGLLVTALRAPAADGVMQRIGMRQARSTVAIWRRRGLQAIAAACVAMAILVIVLPFVQQHRAAIAAQRRIAQLRAPVAEVEALRRKIAGAEAGIDVVAAERARLGRPLRVLAAITDIFPDDTFLTDFTMRQGKLDMAGQSSGAAKLIAALAADPAIRNPAFAAPVNRLENGTADVFSIHAEAAP